MKSDLKKLISNLHRETYRKAKKNMMYRYKKYTAYCQVLASSENEEIRKVGELFEKDAPAYMAPVVLSFAHCKLTPHTLKDKSFDDMWLPELIGVAGDALNASLLHSIRILLDRTSLYMHAAYNECEIGDGIGSINGAKKYGVMKFVDKQLNSLKDLSEEERLFFQYFRKEYGDWLHKFMVVDNKTKHNLSAYDIYEIGRDNMPPIILASSKGYYSDKQLKTENEIPVDFEAKYMSHAYELFDKTLEFTTTIIMTKVNETM